MEVEFGRKKKIRIAHRQKEIQKNIRANEKKIHTPQERTPPPLLSIFIMVHPVLIFYSRDCFTSSNCMTHPPPHPPPPTPLPHPHFYLTVHPFIFYSQDCFTSSNFTTTTITVNLTDLSL